MRESTQSYVLANGSTVIPELCVFCFISYIYCVQEGFNILFYLCSLLLFNLQQYLLLGGLFFRECAISDPFNVYSAVTL